MVARGRNAARLICGPHIAVRAGFSEQEGQHGCVPASSGLTLPALAGGRGGALIREPTAELSCAANASSQLMWLAT